MGAMTTLVLNTHNCESAVPTVTLRGEKRLGVCVCSWYVFRDDGLRADLPMHTCLTECLCGHLCANETATHQRSLRKKGGEKERETKRERYRQIDKESEQKRGTYSERES